MTTEQLVLEIVSITMSVIAIVCSSIAITMRVNDRRRCQNTTTKQRPTTETTQFQFPMGWTTIGSETTYKPSGKRNKKRERK